MPHLPVAVDEASKGSCNRGSHGLRNMCVLGEECSQIDPVHLSLLSADPAVRLGVD
jgi:hypothetical protein